MASKVSSDSNHASSSELWDFFSVSDDSLITECWCDFRHLTCTCIFQWVSYRQTCINNLCHRPHITTFFSFQQEVLPEGWAYRCVLVTPSSVEFTVNTSTKDHVEEWRKSFRCNYHWSVARTHPHRSSSLYSVGMKLFDFPFKLEYEQNLHEKLRSDFSIGLLDSEISRLTTLCPTISSFMLVAVLT